MFQEPQNLREGDDTQDLLGLLATDDRKYPAAVSEPLQHDVRWMIGMRVHNRPLDQRAHRLEQLTGRLRGRKAFGVMTPTSRSREPITNPCAPS